MLNRFKLQSYTLVILGLVQNNIFSYQYCAQNILVTRAPGKDAYLRELAWYEVKRDAENLRNCLFASSFQLNIFYEKLSRKRELGAYFSPRGRSTAISYRGGFGAHTVDTDLNSEFFVHDAIVNDFDFLQDSKIYRYKKPNSDYPNGRVIEIRQDGSAVLNVLGAETLGPTVDNNTNLKLALANYSSFADNRALAGSIDFEIDRRVWGAMLSYYAYSAGGFWLQFDLPILQIKNKLIPKVKTEKKLDDPELSRKVSMLDLICGDYSLSKDFVGPNDDNPNAQNKLLYSKFSRQELEKSGVGDLDITIGYRFADHQKFDCDGFIRFSIPTAEAISPEYLFAPQLGNNGHFVLSLGACCSADILDYSGWCVEGLANSSVSYFFPATQLRTLSSFVDRQVVLPWDRYILVQKIGASGPLVPGANIFTTDVKVSPGFSTETVLSLGLRKNSFLGNIGVSLFSKQGENLQLNQWPESGLYGKPSVVEYRTTDVFSPTSAPFEALDLSDISKKSLSLMQASTPGSVAANFFVQAGYFDQDPAKKPFTACVGLAYEFCNDNSSLSHFTFWAKGGIAF